ncbi:MAG: DUF4097 family beta strand repeat protein [Oscillospiraceae bacterium]|nr:DUF4097 family beta strand repeat protein [Oscillospiraceae bacterium]
MIKRIVTGLFSVLIPVCVLSFIIGGVFHIVLGEKNYSYGGYHDGEYVVSDNTTYANHDIKGEFEQMLPAKSGLTFMLSGVDADIMISDCDEICVTVKNGNTERDVKVALSTMGDTSIIEIHPTNITFNLTGGLINWLDDIFGNAPKCSVTVKVPQGIYQNLTVKQGSGKVSINNIIANYNDIDIGSGSFYYVKTSVKVANEFDVSLGSGKAVLENANADRYRFNIGSGYFSAKGLTGTGNVNIGSGNVTLSYQSFSNLYLKKGSGTLNMLVPPSTSFKTTASIGSGWITLDTDNADQSINKSGEYYIGSEETGNIFDVNNGSGNIYIKNNDGNDFVEVPQTSGIIADSSYSSSSSSDNSSSSSGSLEPSYASGITSTQPDGFEENSSDASDSSSSGTELLTQLIYQTYITDGIFRYCQ